MKVNNDFVLRKISDTTVLVPVGKTAVDFNAMIKLNDTGAYLFKQLQNGTDEQALIDNLVNDYDVSREQAENDVSSFIIKLKDAGLIEQ